RKQQAAHEIVHVDGRKVAIAITEEEVDTALDRLEELEVVDVAGSVYATRPNDSPRDGIADRFDGLLGFELALAVVFDWLSRLVFVVMAALRRRPERRERRDVHESLHARVHVAQRLDEVARRHEVRVPKILVRDALRRTSDVEDVVGPLRRE